MTNDRIREGGCQCGAIRYRAAGEPVLAALCHCSSCRRASAAPTTGWAMFPQTQVTFTKGEPTTYASSAEGRRGFCNRCGTQVCFTASFLPGLIDMTIGSFDAPESLPPTMHYWDSKRLPWMRFADDLQVYPEFPPPP
ncbi:MAG TPA: GFA family protein [Steroidobacteraceae bacterium]|nr:GFA family protein [Steroidobacteraceae bacterium]